MSRQIVYSAVSEEALVDNIAAVFVADFKWFLDELYPGQDLQDFVERALGQVLGINAPFMALAPVRNASVESEDGHYLREALRVDLLMGVIADSPDTVTRMIQRYMRTGEAVLRAANKDELFGTVNRDNTFGFSLDCEHVYQPDIRTNQVQFFRNATLQITVNIHER